MAARPASYLNWVPSNNPAYIQTPTAGQLTTGWLFREAPPFQYMNWIHNLEDQWIQYFDSILIEGYLTTDLVAANVTVAVGTSLFHPNLIIDTGTTWQVDGSLFSVSQLIVNGTLIVTGLARAI